MTCSDALEGQLYPMTIHGRVNFCLELWQMKSDKIEPRVTSVATKLALEVT